jgi:hypothetical protein
MAFGPRFSVGHDPVSHRRDQHTGLYEDRGLYVNNFKWTAALSTVEWSDGINMTTEPSTNSGVPCAPLTRNQYYQNCEATLTQSTLSNMAAFTFIIPINYLLHL